MNNILYASTGSMCKYASTQVRKYQKYVQVRKSSELFFHIPQNPLLPEDFLLFTSGP